MGRAVLRGQLLRLAAAVFILCTFSYAFKDVLGRVSAGSISGAAARNQQNWTSLTYLSELIAKSSGGNVMLGAHGLHSSLSVLILGARGRTKDGLEKILPTDSTLLNSGQKASTATASGFAERTALWTKGGTLLKPTFKDACKRRFQCELFGGGNLAAIDAWFREASGGQLDKAPIQDVGDITIGNVSTRSDRWASPFRPQQTKDAVFHTARGSSAVRMMSQTSDFAIGDFRGWTAIAPLRHAATALFLLPPNTAQPRDVGALNIAELANSLRLQFGSVSIPRFTISSQINFLPLIARTPAAIALGSEADFSAMTEPGLHVTAMQQDTRLDVSEDGLKATAGTEILFERGLSSTRSAAYHIVFDRPFFVVITDESFTRIEFAASITDPHPLLPSWHYAPRSK